MISELYKKLREIALDGFGDIVVRGDILRLAFIRCAAKTQSLFSGQYIR